MASPAEQDSAMTTQPNTPAPRMRRPRRWRPPLYVRSSLNLAIQDPATPPLEYTTSDPTSASTNDALLLTPPLPIDIGNAHPQRQSPLFGTLPPELRSAIFELALAQAEDAAETYPADHPCCRPGYTARRRAHVELLRTCRVVYAETRHIPAGYELTLWCGDVDRAPPDSKEQRLEATAVDAVSNAEGATVVGGLTLVGRSVAWPRVPWSSGVMEKQEKQRQQQKAASEQIQGRLHMFAQQWWLEQRRLSALLKTLRITTRAMTLTIRHTDWWYWDEDRPLGLDREWIDRLRLPETVREFDLELETVERKRDELDCIADQARLWPIVRRDGEVLSAAGSEPKISRWVGSRKIKGSFHSEEVSDAGLPYYIVTLQWRLEDEG